MSEAIVVMERDGALPDWVDEQGERDSDVWIIAQQAGESYAEFAARAILQLPVLGGAARLAVLVHGPDEGTEDATPRRALIAAMCERMRPVSGRVVLVPAAERDLTRAA